MPRQQIDYMRTKIYKIVSNDLKLNELYVGSTTDFRKRKNEHKRSCNNANKKDYNYKIYQTIRLNGGWENWSMILIESYPCNNGLEARRRERYWYEELKPSMNTILPFISKEEKVEKGKEYRQKNKDNLAENKKEYRHSNQEKIAEYQKEYRHSNKEKLEGKAKEIVNCPICDKQLMRKSLSRHCKVIHPINLTQ
jgi:hypothetical protein